MNALYRAPLDLNFAYRLLKSDLLPRNCWQADLAVDEHCFNIAHVLVLKHFVLIIGSSVPKCFCDMFLLLKRPKFHDFGVLAHNAFE